MGCKTDAFACDTGNLSTLQSVVETCAQKQWDVRGVVQCAMVLRDSTFKNMTHQKWTKSIQPKINGSWNLYETLGSRDFDSFIMLSYVSGIIGNPAQGNYTAGNTYHDSLALYRHQRGFLVTALAVGAVMDVGAFTDNSYFENFLDKFEHLSSLQVKIEGVMIILQALIKGRIEEGCPIPPLLAMGFTEELKCTCNITSLWPKDRKFDFRIGLPDNSGQTVDTGNVRVADLLRQGQEIKEVSSVVENALKANLANAMTASPEDVDADTQLHSYGFDSLKTVEVRIWLFRELKCDISVFDILSPMSLANLSTRTAVKILQDDGAILQTPTPPSNSLLVYLSIGYASRPNIGSFEHFLPGADHILDYCSAALTSDIHALTNGDLHLNLNCTTTRESIVKLCEALFPGSPSQGTSELKYCGLFTLGSLPRSDIRAGYTLAYTALGESFQKWDNYYQGSKEDGIFAGSFMRLTSGLLEGRMIKNHPAEVRPGGLSGVLDGLNSLRKGEVSGKKLVY